MKSTRLLLLSAFALGLLQPATLAQKPGKPKLVREPVQEEKEGTSAPDVPTEYNPAKARKHVEVGKYYFKQQRWEAAHDRFRDALNFQPDFPDAYLWIARSLEKQKKYQEAAAALLEYEQKFPASPELKEIQKERHRLEQKS